MDHREHLPIGAELVGDYLIEGILGSGGFGVTYAARDVRLGTRVAIKEYFPSDFGTRDGTLSIHPKSGRHAELFEWGRTGFLDEARTLARFDHPAIVRVIRVFEALNTAYMVLKFEEGQSLKSWLDGLARRPTQDELDRIVGPLLDALEVLHASDFLHRDIAPDNIIVRPDGSPVLLDFGSARQAIAQETKTLTGIVKPGYSPPEQYSARSTRQGPWTDIYALGATLYKAVTGATPVDGPDRVLEDTLEPVAANAGGGYRTSFLDAIDLMLRVRPEARPQSIAALRAALSEVSAGSSGTVTVRSVPSALPSPAVSAPSEVIAAARQSETRELRPRKPYALLALMGAALIGLGVYLARDGLSPGPTSRSGEPKRMAQVPQPPNDPPKERAKPLEPRDEHPAELPPVAPRALPPSQPQMPPAPVPKEDRRADPAPSPIQNSGSRSDTGARLALACASRM
ncbi:MAG: protein kinase [Hyphomicrobiaceae bacterium]